MYRKSACANCTYFRPLKFNFSAECCVEPSKETSEQPPNIIPDFKNNGVKPFVPMDRTMAAAGVCLKSIEIITDAHGNSMRNRISKAEHDTRSIKSTYHLSLVVVLLTQLLNQ